MSGIERLAALLESIELDFWEHESNDDDEGGFIATFNFAAYATRLIAAGVTLTPTPPDALREAYAAALEATDPFIWDYPMTEDERRYAWKHLHETRAALRAALEPR